MRTFFVDGVVHLVFCLLVVSLVHAEDDKSDLSERLKAAKAKLPQNTFLMKYKFREGESIEWSVRHLATTETKIKGETQEAQSSTASSKVWTIEKVDEEGNITFVNTLKSVNMWKKVTGESEVRYNSSTDDEPPLDYRSVAKAIGVPLSKVTITPTGHVIKHTSASQVFELGVADLTVPFPAAAIRVGQKWHTTDEVTVVVDGRSKKIKVRQQFQLATVQTALATIKVKTQVITPFSNPKIESQLVQKITHGTVKFDMDAGRIVSKHFDWDESVVGFSGADSRLKYLARFTEKIQSDSKTVRRNTEQLDLSAG